MPDNAPGSSRHRGMRRIGRGQHRRTRHRRVGIARIVVAVHRVLQRVKHLGRVADAAGVDAAAVAIDVGADRSAIETDHRLVRQDQRDRIVIGRAAAGGSGFLAQAAITMLVLTDNAEPELDPSEAARVVS